MMQSEQAAARFFFIVIHTARPEPALPVRLAVIESVVIGVAGGQRNRRRRSGIEVIKVEAGLQRNNQSAIFTDGQRADIFRRRPVFILAIGRVKPVDQVTFDINPIQSLVGDIPKGSLTEQSLRIVYAGNVRRFVGGHGHGGA